MFDLDRLFRRLEDAKRVAYDTETTGLDWKKDKICGHVISFGPKLEDSYYVPVRHASNNIDDVKRFEKMLFKALTGKQLFGHHFKFDTHMVRATCGVRLEKIAPMIECTMVNQSLLDELQGRFGLDECAAKFKLPINKDERIYAEMAKHFGGKPDRDQMNNFWKMPGDDPLVAAYAIADGATTWALRDVQHVELERQELMRVWKLETRVLRTLARMEARGVRVNEDALERLRKKLMDDIQSIDLPEDFNVRSSKQLADLFLSQGHDPSQWPKTAPSTRFPSGQYSFTEAWLSKFELGQRIVRVRKYTNLINSFIDPLRTRHVVNWRVHTTFNQIKQDDYGVVSGRLSSSDPNMQQVPKHDAILAPLFREVFEPDDDMYWSSNDYKQQEFVVFACYSRSVEVMNNYRRDPPIDMHQTVADLMHVDRNTKAKRLNLGKLYGMGVEKLAASLDVEYKEAQNLSREWDRIMPTAKEFRYLCQNVVERRSRENGGVGFISTWFGRRRRYPGAINAHAAMSGLIQGACADACKDKMCEVDEYFESEGDKAHLLLQVHDSLDWQTPKGNVKFDKEARRIMQDFARDPYVGILENVPMRIDTGEGKNWREASFG